jgi:hypothetical protein
MILNSNDVLGRPLGGMVGRPRLSYGGSPLANILTKIVDLVSAICYVFRLLAGDLIRQALGFNRRGKQSATSERIPGVEFPRVTGNSEQRREWHPTQHPEGLLERVFRLSGAKTVLDCYAGTGTSLRVAKKLGVSCDAIEIDMAYAQRIATEMGLVVSEF